MSGASASPAGTTFLTIFEVAAIMRVSKRTVYRLVHDGHLEAARSGDPSAFLKMR
jgi:excisionase family DNA binding protein